MHTPIYSCRLSIYILLIICVSCNKTSPIKNCEVNTIEKENKKTAKSSFISEDNPSTVDLPLSFHQYFKDQYSEMKYPSYELNENLIDFLKSKNYDGETYKGFVIRSDNDFEFLLVSMARGDSEYFILITSANHKIIDYKEIGAIGDENPVTFKISQDFSIEKYHGNNENSTAFEKYQIDNNGNIRKK
ncbi:hypothetical protein SAMN05443633_12218 [Chryseobacterium arachidis]|uniref:Uncharacterized protein n=2 Tax=Chryseobacterium arachidis TaxID=1416778 RepID=A0A1M5MG59_9FLAO|nr:hypothetical protein SAMN05443633_12218 [Chryseobacterium arachidis]